MRAYELFRDRGYGATAILMTLEQEFEKPVSQRTVESWLHGFKNLGDDIKARDDPFSWSALGGASIPWEASEWILRCQQQGYQGQLEAVAFARSLGIDVGTIHIIAATFTNRLVTWYWRIHLAAPDLISPSDVEPLALLCAAQERMQDIAGKPMDIAMLEDWLTLRPDLERRYGVQGAWQRYWDAVDLGLVKKPIPKTLEEAHQYVMAILGRQVASGILRRPGAEHHYTGPNPVLLWAVLTGVILPTQPTTEAEEPKEEQEGGAP